MRWYFWCWWQLQPEKQGLLSNRDLIWSCLITFLFYTFFRTSQVNGWGYRYAYSILGNLVLLSLIGWQELRKQIGASKSTIILGEFVGDRPFGSAPD